MTNQQLIETAIKNKNQIAFHYNGTSEPGETRIVEPYCIYVTSKTKTIMIDCWQESGKSESGNSEGWKMFKLDNIGEIEILPIKFIYSSQFNPKSNRYKNTICKMKFEPVTFV